MERGCGAGLPGKAEVKKKKSWAQGKPSWWLIKIKELKRG